VYHSASNSHKTRQERAQLETVKPVLSMITVFSPGRVNLIGEHTDYNDGYVMPAAIDRGLTMHANLNRDGIIRLVARDVGQTFSCRIDEPLPHDGFVWTHYVLGVVEQMWDRGMEKSGFDLDFGGNLPIGAGMSSSAALTGGTAFCLNELTGMGYSRPQLATIAQAAEHQFVGIRSGILDQFANLNCIEGHAMLLDCRSLEVNMLPFPSDQIAIVLCDTTIRRELVASEYNARRAQCEAAVAALQPLYPEVASLRDVSQDMLMIHREKMDPITWRRSRYVVLENERTVEAAKALTSGDMVRFGELMLESHRGLQHEYNVSCKELDIMVELALPLDGMIGCRMMGGGFGGCTINLVMVDHVEAFTASMRDSYLNMTGLNANIHVAGIKEGTRIVKTSDT
jgi:galactokinase